jgi:hypothetical protein
VHDLGHSGFKIFPSCPKVLTIWNRGHSDCSGCDRHRDRQFDDVAYQLGGYLVGQPYMATRLNEKGVAQEPFQLLQKSRSISGCSSAYEVKGGLGWGESHRLPASTGMRGKSCSICFFEKYSRQVEGLLTQEK